MSFFANDFFKKPFFKNEFFGDPFFLNPFFDDTTIAHPYTAGTFDAFTIRVICTRDLVGDVSGDQLRLSIEGVNITEGIIAQSGTEFDIDISPREIVAGEEIRLTVLPDPANNVGAIDNGVVANNVV